MLVLTVKGDDLSIMLANTCIRNQQAAADNQPELTCIIIGRQRWSDPEQPNLLPHNQPSPKLSQSRSGDSATDVHREQISRDTRSH